MEKEKKSRIDLKALAQTQICLKWSKVNYAIKPNMTRPSLWRLQQRSYLLTNHSIYLEETKFDSISFLTLKANEQLYALS